MSGSKYSIIVSSLYGISKVMLNERDNICQVIFSGKVPFLFIDDFITKKSEIEEILRNTNVLELSPIKALNLLYELKEKLK